HAGGSTSVSPSRGRRLNFTSIVFGYLGHTSLWVPPMTCSSLSGIEANKRSHAWHFRVPDPSRLRVAGVCSCPQCGQVQVTMAGRCLLRLRAIRRSRHLVLFYLAHARHHVKIFLHIHVLVMPLRAEIRPRIENVVKSLDKVGKIVAGVPIVAAHPEDPIQHLCAPVDRCQIDTKPTFAVLVLVLQPTRILAESPISPTMAVVGNLLAKLPYVAHKSPRIIL